jgi:hypothetical protein
VRYIVYQLARYPNLFYFSTSTLRAEARILPSQRDQEHSKFGLLTQLSRHFFSFTDAEVPTDRTLVSRPINPTPVKLIVYNHTYEFGFISRARF